MLPPRWTHPACMNMEVKRVRESPRGLARKRAGTKAHSPRKASPPVSSTKKNRTFRAIKAYVTSGTVLREVLASPIGNMGAISSNPVWMCPQLDVRMCPAILKERDLLAVNSHLELKEMHPTALSCAELPAPFHHRPDAHIPFHLLQSPQGRRPLPHG